MTFKTSIYDVELRALAKKCQHLPRIGLSDQTTMRSACGKASQVLCSFGNRSTTWRDCSSINGDWFGAYATRVLISELRPRGHRRHGQPAESCVRRCAKSRGGRRALRFLPPYSPNFNPIEKAFSHLNAMLHKIGERTVSGLWGLISKLVHISWLNNAPINSAYRYMI